MKKNGFTLIELLGVIVILAVIALITIPIIDRSLNKGKQNLDKAQKEQIIKALKDYYASNKITGSPACKKISELKSSGNLPDSVKNPLTGGDYGTNDKACVEQSGGTVSVYQTNIKYKYYVEIGGTKYYE